MHRVFWTKNRGRALSRCFGKIPDGDHDPSLRGFFQADDGLHLFQCRRIIISLPTVPAHPGRDILNDNEPALVAVLDGYFFCVYFSIAVLTALVFHISPPLEDKQ